MNRHYAWPVVASLMVIATVSCGGDDSSTAEGGAGGSHTLTGSVRVGLDPERAERTDKLSGGKLSDLIGNRCDGSSIDAGYADIAAGADVVVADGSGDTVAIGRLRGGTAFLGGCEMSFEVANVPDAKFYSVEVADRGAQRFTRAELAADGWSVDLELIAT